MTNRQNPLRRRGFFALWAAQVVSNLGDRLYELALIWLVYEQTGDPLIVATVTFASVCSAAIATVPAGSIVDRVDRRSVLIASHLVRGVVILLIPLVGISDGLVALLVGVALVSGIAEAFFGPARNALIPELVPPDELDTANSISYITQNASQTLYAVGGVVVGVLGAMVAFTVNAITFFVAASILFLIPPASRRNGTDEGAAIDSGDRSTLSEFRTAIGLVRSNDYLPSIIALSIVSSFAIGPIGLVMPFYIEAITSPNSIVFGGLYASFFVGMFLGGLGQTRVNRNLDRGRQIIFGTIISGSAIVAMALVPPFVGAPVAVAAGLFLISGVFTIFIKVPIRTYIQLVIPGRDLGKVLALLNLSMLVAPPISIVLAGLLLEAVSAIVVLGLIGCIVVAAGSLALATPLWRESEGAHARSAEAPSSK